MLIATIYLFIGVLFMALCYAVAVAAAPRRPRLVETDSSVLARYLFAPASPAKATAGMVGSTISFYITIYTCACLSFGWGSLFIIVLAVAIPLAFLLFYVNVARLIRQRSPGAAAADAVITYIDQLRARHGLRTLLTVPLLLMGVYVVFTVGTEMRALQILYRAMTTVPTTLIAEAAHDAPHGVAFEYGLFVLLACLGYVLRGGYPAVMTIDLMQIAIFVGVSLLVLAAMALHGAPDPIALIRIEFVGPGRWHRVLTIIAAACVLICCWFTAAIDNWIRIAGAFFDHVAQRVGPVPLADAAAHRRAIAERVLARLRGVLAVSAALCFLLTLVPSLAGLYLRHDAITAWLRTADSCARATSFAVADGRVVPTPPGPALAEQRQPASFLQRDLMNSFTLIPDLATVPAGTCPEASWLGPPTADPVQGRRFPAFEISPYRYLALAIDDAWVDHFEQGTPAAQIGWLCCLVAFVVGVVCAVITTVNCYLLCIAQMLHGFALPARLGWLKQPLVATLIAGALIATLLGSGAMRDDTYISFGIMAFGSIMFLAPISTLAVWEPRAHVVRRALRALLVGYLAWSGWWLLHIWQQNATLPWLAFADRLVRPRSSVVTVGAAVVVLCLVWTYGREALRTRAR